MLLSPDGLGSDLDFLILTPRIRKSRFDPSQLEGALMMRSVHRLLALGAVAIVLASNAASQTTQSRRYLNLPGRTVQAPFSDAVLVGNTLYLAGRIGLDPQTGQAPADLEREIHLLLDGMKTTLESASMTMDDLVTVQVFCPD